MREPQIVLSDNSLSKKEYGLMNIGKLVTVIMLLVGLFAVEHCFLRGGLSIPIMALSGIGVILALFVIDQQKWTYIKYGVLIIAVVLTIVPPSVFINGFLNFANQIIELCNNQFNGSVATYQINGYAEAASYKFWAVANLLISLGLAYFLRKDRIEVIGLILLVLMLAAAYFHLSIDPICYGFFVIGLLLSFIGENLFQQKFIKVLPFIIGTILVVVLIAFLTEDFHGNEKVYDLKEGVKSGVEKIRYGEDTLPQGDLTQAYDMVGSDSNYTLTIEGDVKNELHLKGFIGSNFTGTKWEVLDGSSYTGEMNGFLKWLSDKNFESQYQYAYYVKVADIAINISNVKIKNVGANSKYIYLPYEAIGLSDEIGDVNHDWQITSSGLFGEKEYAFDVLDNGDYADTIIYKDIDTTTEDGANYRDAEAVYSDFVTKNYLTVPEDVQNLISEKIFEGEDWSAYRLSEITSKIRLLLQAGGNKMQNTASEYDGNENFVKWFTDGGKGCNSAYYATMGVLAYRNAGIPARYVEGYYVQNSDIYKAKDNTINVSESDAHSWVEIYMNQIGWVPVEVSPGFYSTEYTTSGVAPSPNSTVNIVQNEDDTISGKTSDTLKNEEKKEPPKPPKETILHWFGVGILLLLILVLIKVLMELQAMLRRRNYTNKIEGSAERENQCRLVFDRVCAILTIYNVARDFRFPYESTDKFEETFPGMRTGSYERMLELIEKSIFREDKISDMEYRTIIHFLNKLADEAYEHASLIKKIKLKYIYAV